MFSPLGRIEIALAVMGALTFMKADLFGQTLVPAGRAKLSFDIADLRLPLWSAGQLAVIEKNDTASPVLHFFNRQGLEQPPVAFALPDANVVRIEGVARGPGGEIAICGLAYDRAGRGGGYVAWLSSDRKVTAIAKLFPYAPYHVAIRRMAALGLKATS